MAGQSAAAAVVTRGSERGLVRFGTFELDRATGELRRNGRRVALQDQPARALGLLVSSAGQLVTRDALREALWPADTFVDFETALNIVVTKVRQALHDSAASPRFIETVPKRGYRFIADVHLGEEAARSEAWAGEAAPDPGAVRAADPPAPVARRGAFRWGWLVAVPLLLTAAIAGTYALIRQPDGQLAGPRSIAVLPFKPLIASENDERMQLGMTEALINRLSRIQSLRVEPLARVRRYGALDQDPILAGLELGVDAVVEGHFQRLDGRVHVRSRLLRLADGTTLATSEYKEAFSDIFAVQAGVAQAVAAALELTLTPAERARLRQQDTTDAEAYRHYLFGRHHLEIRDPEHVQEAEREFREALRLDPGYARAHAALALTLTHMAWLSVAPGSDVMGPAKAAALRALAIDESVALAHTALGTVYEAFEYDAPAAQREHARAMELDAQDPWILRAYAHFLMTRDAFDDALEVNRRDLELDPTSPLSNRFKVLILFVARRYDECVSVGRRNLLLDPGNLARSHNWLSRCLEQQGRNAEAVEVFEQGRTRHGNAPDQDALADLPRSRLGRLPARPIHAPGAWRG